MVGCEDSCLKTGGWPNSRECVTKQVLVGGDSNTRRICNPSLKDTRYKRGVAWLVHAGFASS